MPISTIKVTGKMGAGFRTEIGASHNMIVDQPKAMGGNDEGCNPMELFLASLPACICAIGRIVANQKKITLRGIDVAVEGDIDKAFLLGSTTEGRAGFTEIRSYVTVDADMSQEEKEAFVHEIERRCPIADNISEKSTISTSVK